MKSTLLIVFITFSILVDVNSSNSRNNTLPKVTSPSGTFQGTMEKTALGKTIYSFKSIRYAKPPINDSRFKAPEPAEKFTDIYDAVQDLVSCPQPFLRENEMSEDCLMLNVYTKNYPETAEDTRKQPVIVYFFGGAFTWSDPLLNNTGPQYFLDEDIVLVIPNYRVGAFGFLSTGGSEAPGNNGLKDQALALRWIHDNIAAFGGDPDCVTIIGFSSSAAAVVLHLLSPLSKGLFHRVVAMSAPIFNNIPVGYADGKLSERVAKILNCPDISEKFMACIKMKSTKEIVDVYYSFLEFGFEPLATWFPVIEPEGTKGAFLLKDPVKSLSQGDFEQVPFLIGFNQYEQIDRMYGIISNESLLIELSKHFDKVAPIILIYRRNNSENISESLKSFYFGDKPIDKSDLVPLGELYSDHVINFGVQRTVNLLTKYSRAPVYFYHFEYIGKYSYFKQSNMKGGPYRPIHKDELIYLFYNAQELPLFTKDDTDYQTVKRLTKMWANFARTGEPIPQTTEELDNVTWEAHTSSNENCMIISDKLVLVNETLYPERYELWDELFPLTIND